MVTAIKVSTELANIEYTIVNKLASIVIVEATIRITVTALASVIMITRGNMGSKFTAEPIVEEPTMVAIVVIEVATMVFMSTMAKEFHYQSSYSFEQTGWLL